MRKSIRKLLFAVVAMVLSLMIGVIGYYILEGFSFLESLYMSVITISTVGFSEVKPLTTGGKIFTIFYIIMNLGIFAYVVSTISTYLFEGELQKIYSNFIIGREVKKMKNHVIVCGFGRNGVKAAEELYKSRKDFIIIEEEAERIAMSRYKDFQFIKGDATLDEILLEAGIQKAHTIITTLPKDSDNVFITLTARELNPAINIISRASEEKSEKKLIRAGANFVVMPETLGGLHMAQIITNPYVIEFLDVINGVGTDNLSLHDFSYDNFREDCQGKSLRELDIRKRSGATVIAIKHPEKGFIFNPNPDNQLSDREILIALGTADSIEKFKSEYIR